MRTLSPVITTSLVAAFLGAGATEARAQESGSRTLTVEEAVEVALSTNPRLLGRQSVTRSAEALEHAATGRMLPSVHVFDEYQHWNAPFSIPFGAVNFTVRDQDTNTLAISANQPLVGLMHLSQDHTAQQRAAEATHEDLAAERANIKERVEVGYLRLFEAKALEDIAKASEAELADQVTVTTARVTAGVLTTADLLRVKVAVANAKQQEIQAHTQGEIERAGLLGVLGLPMEQSVEFAEPRTLLAHASAALPPLKDAQGQAAKARPELRSLQLQLDASDHTRKARKYLLLPDVDAEAGYSRLDGQPFSPVNSAFVGVKANWNIWEWGATWYAQKAAEEQASAVHFQLEEQGRQIGVEVATDLAQARASASAVDVARETIASAEEAYRVTEALLKAGSATTTDLLDAQAALTQARLNLTRAEYEQAVAQVTLQRGLGR